MEQAEKSDSEGKKAGDKHSSCAAVARATKVK